MANKITNETLKFNVVVNGNQAQSDLIKLEKQQRELVETQKDLRTQKKLLRKEDENYKQELDRLNNAIDENNRELLVSTQLQKNLRKEIGLTALTPKQLRRELKTLKAQFDNTFDPTEQKRLRLEIEKLETQLGQVSLKAKKAGRAMDESKKSSGGFKAGLQAVAFQITAVIAGFTALIQGLSRIIDVTAKFQKFEAVLRNTLGSALAAKEALNLIKDFAATTPFQVDELTESFVKLSNMGFVPTRDEMRKLGDLAASTGKTFDQLTEAVLDAQTFEFERLKEFGIRAKKNNDSIAFTFKGVTTEVGKSSQAVREYLLSLGDIEGVSGSMAAISQTLEGQLSNLEDTFMILLNTIGQHLAPVFTEVIGKIKDLTVGFEGFASGEGKSFIRVIVEIMKNWTMIIDVYKMLFKEVGGIFKAFSSLAKVLGIMNDSGSAMQFIFDALFFVLKRTMLPLRALIWAWTKIIEAFTWIIGNVPFVSDAFDWLIGIVDKLILAYENFSKMNDLLIERLFQISEVHFPRLTKRIKEFLDWLGIIDSKPVETMEERLANAMKKGTEETVKNMSALAKARSDLAKKNNESAQKEVKGEKETADERLKVLEDLIVKTQEIQNQRRLNVLSEDQREVAAVHAKYDQLIQAAIEGEQRKDELSLAFHQQRLELEKQRNAEVNMLKIQQENDFQNEIFELRKSFNLLSQSEIYNADMQAFMDSEAFKTLSATEQEEIRQQIRLQSFEQTKELFGKQIDEAKLMMELTTSLVGVALAENEESFKENAKNFLSIILKQVKNLVQASIVGVTAQSLASPESVATLGVAGLAKAAIMIGLIEGAFAAFESKIQQFEDGRYTVKGADDGKVYSNIPFIGTPKTGFLPKSPALISESGREAIISAKHLKDPIVSNLFQQIRYRVSEVPQRQTGTIETANATITGNNTIAELSSKVESLTSAFVEYAEKVDDWSTTLKVILDYNNFIETDNNIKNIEIDTTL